MDANQKQSWATQLGWVITTRGYLEDLQTAMNNFSACYNSQVEKLGESQYMAEDLEEIKKMNKSFDKKVAEINAHVKKDHIPFLDNLSTYIRVQINS